jgi:hypothetical protein
MWVAQKNYFENNYQSLIFYLTNNIILYIFYGKPVIQEKAYAYTEAAIGCLESETNKNNSPMS